MKKINFCSCLSRCTGMYLINNKLLTIPSRTTGKEYSKFPQSFGFANQSLAYYSSQWYSLLFIDCRLSVQLYEKIMIGLEWKWFVDIKWKIFWKIKRAKCDIKAYYVDGLLMPLFWMNEWMKRSVFLLNVTQKIIWKILKGIS